MKINSNSKIPVLVDRNGVGGREVQIFESGAILLYLAEKTGKLIPTEPIERQECLCWLFLKMGAGPFFGQFCHFTRQTPESTESTIERYKLEVQRLIYLLEKRLEGRFYLVSNELTIADVAWAPWVLGLEFF
jgi:GST-like protein